MPNGDQSEHQAGNPFKNRQHVFREFAERLETTLYVDPRYKPPLSLSISKNDLIARTIQISARCEASQDGKLQPATGIFFAAIAYKDDHTGRKSYHKILRECEELGDDKSVMSVLEECWTTLQKITEADLVSGQ